MPNYPTGYASWIADAELTAKHHGARWVGGPYSDSINNAIVYGQYEPWYGFRRLASHIGGDALLETYAEAAEDAWRPYSVNNSGQVTGFYHYTDGFRLDWTQNGDTASRDALIDQHCQGKGASVELIVRESFAEIRARLGIGRQTLYNKIKLYQIAA